MTGTTNITTAALDDIRRQVKVDSPLFAERLLRGGNDTAACSYSNLFAAAAGEDLAGRYRLPIEYIFEGYLLHYGESRLLGGGSESFNLLAGDYMYARGLDYLAATGDLFSIRILADLISLCSYLHCQEMDRGLTLRAWSLAVICIAANAAGVGGPCGDCLGTFDGIRSGAWEGSVGRGEINTLTSRMLAAFPEERRGQISAQIDLVHSGFAKENSD